MVRRICAVLMLTTSTGALAQVSENPRSGSNVGLEEIVVTARRQAENLQSAPVSVSAVTSAALANVNVRGIDKVSQIVPNLSIMEASGTIGGIQPFIRGIGTSEPLLTVDSPVGIYLDGLYLGRQAASNFELADPARVEVLRGPQGTLFGRNTTGGAINIISRDPESSFGGSVRGGYASFDEWFLKGSLDSGQIGNSGLSATVSAIHRERGPVADNPGIPKSRQSGAFQSTAAYAKIHGEWGALTVDLIGDWSRQTGSRLPFQIISAYEPANSYYSASPTFGGDPFVTGSKLAKPLYLEDVGSQKSEVFGFAGVIAYELSESITFKSISGWRGWDARSPTNYAGNLRGPVVDFTSPTLFSVQRVSPFVSYDQDLRQRQFSQEIQILGKTDSLSYVLGAYYFNERSEEFNTNNFTLVLPPAFLAGLGFPDAVGTALAAQGLDLVGVNLGQTLSYDTVSKSKAAFGQISWKPDILDQRLELTGGLRYTKDNRRLNQPNIPVAGPIVGTLPNPPFVLGVPRSGKVSFDNWSYLASVNFQWTPQFMTYARVSTGYKSGGFDARAGVGVTGTTFDFTYAPEKATAYEIGFKSETADRRLRVNGSAFLTRYNGLQVSQYAGGNGFIPNADATYKGVELEIAARPTANWQVDASLGYTDMSYREFILADPATGIPGDYKDVAKFPYAPKFTAHVGTQYSIPLDWASLVLRADYSRSSKRYFHTVELINPRNEVLADPGQDMVSARISLTDIKLSGGQSTLRVSVYGENLLDKRYRLSAIDFGPSIGIAGANLSLPRRIGVEAELKF